MSALSRIRNNIGFVVVVIAISLLGFILTDFFSSIGNIVAGPPVAGEIAGETISQQEFAERYQQSSQNAAALPQSQRYFIIDQVWNQMINEKVFEDEYKKIGLKISGEEVYDMFTGKDVHPVVQQYFSPPGQEYDRAQVQQLLQNMLADSAQSAQLRLFEDYLADTRAQEKYLNMLASGFVGSKQAARQKNLEQNRKVDISYLGINYTQVPDSLVGDVSDSEIRSYMQENEQKYQQTEQFFIKYVKFDITPSKEDSLRIFQGLLDQKSNFSAVQNDSMYTSGKSRTVFNPNEGPKPLSELPELVKDSIANANEKDVLGPYLDGQYYKIFKVVEKNEGGESFSNIQHILIAPQGNTRADTLAARNQANALRPQVNAANFNDMVNEHSRDFASKPNFGILGWYAKGTYGEDFDRAVDRASVGSIIGPIKSDKGYHIVQILDRSDQTYAVAEIESKIYPGSKSQDEFYRQANLFAAEAQKTNNIDSAAAAMGVSAVRSNPLTQTSWQVGINLPASDGARSLVRWAVDASVGEFSDIEKAGDPDVGESYVYAQLVERKSEGLRSVNDARIEVSTILKNKKKAEYIKNKLGSNLGDDLNAIKDSYGTGAFVNEAKGISFSSTTIPGIGNDPLIIGKASGMNEGEVSAPLEGVNGVYILKATAVTEAPELDEAALADRQKSEADVAKNAFRSKISPALTKLADVEDNRYKIGY